MACVAIHSETVIFLVLYLAFAVLSTTEARPNVLFIVADDMRPEIGVYSDDNSDFPAVHPDVQTPNIDALASQSLLLKRAHCQVAVCNPSRSSALTGRRPETTHIYRNNDGYFRERGGNFSTIPQYFKNHGYLSIGMGKIYHQGESCDPPSWSEGEEYYEAPSKDYWDSKNVSWNAVSAEDREILPLPDEQILEHAIETLQRIADDAISGVQPFFLAVGFYKPHLPFHFPEEFLSLYPMEEIRYPNNPHVPVGMPEVAWGHYGELRGYDDMENVTGEYNTSLPDDDMMAMRQAYVSTISYIDALIGRLLDEVQALGLANNTIVSLFGDHGWQLGEHSEWCKTTNLDRSTNAPMMVKIPGLIPEGGIITEELTEFVDLFPTLAEAADLPVPPLCPEDSSDIPVCIEGESLFPLIQNPADPLWKKTVFSQNQRDNNEIMGYTLRTDQYRYSEWVEFNDTSRLPDWEALIAVELYDHYQDTLEDQNLADDAEYAEVCEELSEVLRAGWREVPRG